MNGKETGCKSNDPRWHLSFGDHPTTCGSGISAPQLPLPPRTGSSSFSCGLTSRTTASGHPGSAVRAPSMTRGRTRPQSPQARPSCETNKIGQRERERSRWVEGGGGGGRVRIPSSLAIVRFLQKYSSHSILGIFERCSSFNTLSKIFLVPYLKKMYFI